MSLTTFIASENKILAFMNQPQVDIDKIDDAAAQKIFMRLDISMSPEALYRDGERPKSEANKLAKIYKAAWEELKKKGFTPKGTYYNMVGV